MFSAIHFCSSLIARLGFGDAVGQPLPKTVHALEQRLQQAIKHQLSDTTFEIRADKNTARHQWLIVIPVKDSLHLHAGDHRMVFRIMVSDTRLHMVIETIDHNPMVENTAVHLFTIIISSGKPVEIEIPESAVPFIGQAGGYPYLPVILGHVTTCLHTGTPPIGTDTMTLKELTRMITQRFGSNPHLASAS